MQRSSIFTTFLVIFGSRVKIGVRRPETSISIPMMFVVCDIEPRDVNFLNLVCSLLSKV